MSVRVSSRVSRIDHVSGTTSSSERDRRERAQAAGERAEHRDERQHVAVEVRVERQQRREVGERERGEHEIGAASADERDDEADRGHERAPGRRASQSRSANATGAEPVALEAEPALARPLADPPGVVGRLARVDEHERARDARRPTTPSPTATASRRRSR